MPCIGIIAEYNPLHQGHVEQLKIIKNRYPKSTIVIIMSGSFVQRGEPALFDKFLRAKWALSNGADLVFELPSYFAVANAEQFAKGGIRLLHRLGIQHCAFGSEYDDLNLLQEAAQAAQTTKVQMECKHLLQQGFFYGHALREALINVYPQIAPIMTNPNALLGMEYIKAALTYHYSINFIPIRRTSEHHSHKIHAPLPSGSAIRHFIKTVFTGENTLVDEQWHTLENAIPKEIFSDVTKALIEGNFVDYDRYGDIILYKGRIITTRTLESITDFEEGLHFLWKKAMESPTWEEALTIIKSKRYSYSRLMRMAAALVLQRTKENTQAVYEAGPLYGRLLGFTEQGRQALKIMTPSIPIITKWGAFTKTASPLALTMANADMTASDIQSLCKKSKTYRGSSLDFYTPIIKI